MSDKNLQELLSKIGATSADEVWISLTEDDEQTKWLAGVFPGKTTLVSLEERYLLMSEGATNLTELAAADHVHPIVTARFDEFLAWTCAHQEISRQLHQDPLEDKELDLSDTLRSYLTSQMMTEINNMWTQLRDAMRKVHEGPDLQFLLSKIEAKSADEVWMAYTESEKQSEWRAGIHPGKTEMISLEARDLLREQGARTVGHPGFTCDDFDTFLGDQASRRKLGAKVKEQLNLKKD